MRSRAGSSLVEVLIAGVITLTSLGAAAGAVARAGRDARLARIRFAAVMRLADRMALLEQDAARTSPRCLSLANGVIAGPGPQEDWTVVRMGSTAQVTARVRLSTAGLMVMDSLQAVLSCE